MAAFVVEVLTSNPPNTALDKESKQRCPLCREEKKLKELRGHVGQHILSRSLGFEEEDLMVKVRLPPPWLTPDSNFWVRLGIILADSVVAIFAAPASWLPEANGRSIQTAPFITSSNTVLLRSLRATRRVQTFQSTALTAQRQFGSTTPLTTLSSGTRIFLAPASTPTLSSRSSAAKTKRGGWVSPTTW